MFDSVVEDIPAAYEKIKASSEEIRFEMASDLFTGSLLRALVSSKPCGRFLELGTGTGLATAWIVAGLDADSSLITVENNKLLMDVARSFIRDQRVEFILADGYEWLRTKRQRHFDLIFADAMPGKYELFDDAIDMLKTGGLYVIDDMLPQPNWPPGHELRVAELIRLLEERTDLAITKLNWSTGIIIAVKK